jgi:hypothetical protein
MAVTPITKYDGDFETPVPCGGVVFSQPFPDTTSQYVLTQPWMMRSARYAPQDLGGPHPVYAGYYLAEESGYQQLGGGLAKWNRTYAMKPATRYTYEMYSYPFIGYWGMTGINVTNVTGRERIAKPCLSRIKHEYFRIANAGADYIDDSQIPILYAQKYYFGTANQLVDYIADSPPFIAPTVPSRSTYESWIADAQANKWGATIGQIVAEDCRIERWMGPIFLRSTRYVLAQ